MGLLKLLLNANLSHLTLICIKPSAGNWCQTGYILYITFAQQCLWVQTRTVEFKGRIFNNQPVINLRFVGYYREFWHSHLASANIIAALLNNIVLIATYKEYDNVCDFI